jgi:general secretion pathway protein E/type IV pilus assembly protein PilB
LVFSTLHTNDAPSTYTRLVDMGVEPFLVASTVEGVMAQRLVRTLCAKCREPIKAIREDLPVDFPWDEFQERGEPLFRNVGCRSCRNSGFIGRQGIFELCLTSDSLRQLAHERTSSWKIRDLARKEGMRTLRQDAWSKVMSGKTTVDEVLRTTKGDRL